MVRRVEVDCDMETPDSITSEQWNLFTPSQKEEFAIYWRRRGIAYFCCLNCGFPTDRGQATCVACRKG